MARKQRLLVAAGVGIRSLAQVAAMAGYRNTSTIYNRMAKGEVIAGHNWKYVDEADRDLSDATASPAVEPLKRAIVCRCAVCQGREWKAGAMHQAFPAIAGMRIWHPTFKRINEITGHQFGYRDRQLPPSQWRKQMVASECSGGEVKGVGELRFRSKMGYEVSPAFASDAMPVNPHFIGAR